MGGPFVDPAEPCGCVYCRDVRVREFIDGGLRAAREQGLPRPMVNTVAACLAREPGLRHAHHTTVGRWLKHCKLWTDPWPGEPGG